MGKVKCEQRINPFHIFNKLTEMTDPTRLFECPRCFQQYDGESRKPKYLFCHDTLCLACAKVTTYYNFLRYVQVGASSDNLKVVLVSAETHNPCRIARCQLVL
jgi:hypothetical protein